MKGNGGVTGRGAAGIGRRLAAAILGAGAVGGFAARACPGVECRFLVYYGRDEAAPIGDYDLVVLDAEAPAALLARRAPGARMLGYVSMGEVHASRAYFAEAEAGGILLGRNPSWPDAWFVDMRAPLWERLVLDRIVPAVLARGFDGVFLDTLDDAEYLEQREPRRHAGMIDAAAGLVRRMRRRFPAAGIMVNRGYALLPNLVGQFDMLLGESVRTTHEADGTTYRRLPENDYAWQRDLMWEARRRFPSLRLYSLDYWDPADRDGIARIYAEQRRNGFVPYVATPDLTRIVPPPREAS
ncbi:endo alpha-1,4 polygalactosaminidase [Roseomonas sp. PWR1]|uniref:Endo alpha-1,4 polygalactosaminidase n=1 Tax=Roseomonas nitratireducens TaxID=2820810 RepID=A0ABS4AV41_9PROT|nr:endo alpha-1,4 polygalactosaminidase [Neoroseomonas nitratireducens]MBP0465234.1 endo alpha-1,4 polygalactosaminidase [Neoroseomonas nitratireducens]